MPHATLIAYPTTEPDCIEAVTVEYERQGEQLWLRFVVEGDPGQILWPPATNSARADDLWRHTCFEGFLSTGDGYCEFNLSPSGQWASYSFSAYREGMRPADEDARVDGLDAGSDYVALEGRIDLPANANRLALSAVIEDIHGQKT